MTLEGSLDAFSLPDIFQLLSFTKKTGSLRISGALAVGVVHFATGSVTGASSDVSRQGLARRLVGAGLVDDERLRSAIARNRDDPAVGIGRALHDAGAIDDGVLHEQVVEQTTDAVFDLLRWGRGDFAFQVDAPNPDDLGVSLPVEEVIAEGRRRLEKWESLTRTVPSPDAVVGVALKAPVDEVALAPDEWSMLALADGRRTVAELVRVSGRGEFATVRTLASLVERGLVAVRPAGDDGKDGVAGLLRRQAELSALEGLPEPQPEPEPEPAPPPPPPQRLASVPNIATQRPEPIAGEPIRRPAATAATAATAVRPPVAATQTVGNAAVAADPAFIERDPSVNKSLLLRLIAGVRGL